MRAIDTMNANETAVSSQWISGRQARLKLGLTPARLFKLVATKEMSVLALPGEPLKYSAADVERIAVRRNAS